MRQTLSRVEHGSVLREHPAFCRNKGHQIFALREAEQLTEGLKVDLQ